MQGPTIDTHDRRPATIVDVAREAGVSFKTVSRVLNGEPNVRACVTRVEAGDDVRRQDGVDRCGMSSWSAAAQPG